MKEKNDNSDNLSNIDKRYELLHAAREYSFDSFLTDVDYKKPILLNEIKRTVRLHATEQNMRVYFSLLALIEEFKIMLRNVDEKDRIVFGSIDEINILKLIEVDSDEDKLINASTKIGDLFLAIVLHAAAIRDVFFGYSLHPYVQIILDENVAGMASSIYEDLTIRANQFKCQAGDEIKYFVDDFVANAQNVAGKIDNSLLQFIEKLNSSAVKNSKDVFEKRAIRIAEKFDLFIHQIKESKDKINFVFRLSLTYSERFQAALKNRDKDAYAKLFERSVSALNVKLRKNKKYINFDKAFHVLKSSKLFGFYTDSYFLLSFDKEGIPFSAEQIKRWGMIDKNIINRLKTISEDVSDKGIAIYLNERTNKGKNLRRFIHDLNNAYDPKNDSDDVEISYSSLMDLSAKAMNKSSYLRYMQKNFELCAFIDEIKTLWSDVVADSIRIDPIFYKKYNDTTFHIESNKAEVIDTSDAGMVLVRDVFEVKNGNGVGLTRDTTWRSKYKITGPVKIKDWMNYNVMVCLLYMQPFSGDKFKKRNVYKGSINRSPSADDFFGATTKRVIADLRFFKLNVLVEDKQLDELREVNHK